VTLGAPDADGLPGMLADLIRGNLAQHPRKWTDFRGLSGRIAIEVTDAAVTAVLDFAAGGLVIGVGSGEEAPIRILVTSERVLGLCALTVPGPVPRLLDPAGRALLAGLAAGEVRIRGMLRHPARLLRFARLMSVNDTRGLAP
jgi:hypothetical protein